MFDLVIADHVLFYCEDIPQVLAECRRVLKMGDGFYAVPTESSICGKLPIWCSSSIKKSFYQRRCCMSGSDLKTEKTC